MTIEPTTARVRCLLEKYQEAESLQYSDPTAAYNVLIVSSEELVSISSRLQEGSRLKGSVRELCSRCLTAAEKIKQRQLHPNSSHTQVSVVPPTQQSAPTTYYGKIVYQSARVQEVLAICAKSKKTFEDSLFPPCSESLYKDTGIMSRLKSWDVVWRRPCEFCTGTPVTFDGESMPGDVLQGELGDCWLLCAFFAISSYYFRGALSLLALKPELLRNLIVEAYKELGLYVVKFFRNRVWVNIVVVDIAHYFLYNSSRTIEFLVVKPLVCLFLDVIVTPMRYGWQ